MSEMVNPHNYRKVGYSMILVAASLSAIGVLHLAIGDNVYNLSDKESTIIIDGINYEYSPLTINAEITVSDVCLQ